MIKSQEYTIDIVALLLFAIIFTLGISYMAYQIAIYQKMNSYINQFRRQGGQTCGNIDNIVYREKVQYPYQLGVYERGLAVALIDISIATTKAHCKNILPIPNPPGFDHQMRIEGKDPLYRKGEEMYGYIFWNHTLSQAVIAFTGTVTESASKLDLQYSQLPPNELNGYKKGMLVHKGFYKIYMAIKNKIWGWLDTEGKNIKNIYITGLSLGGALSILCGFDIANSLSHRNIIQYSYGSPRVGNVEFVKKFNKKVYSSIRIANTEDVIPQLPPAKLDGYTYEQTRGHVPFTICLDNLSQDHIEAYIDYLPICSEVAPCANQNDIKKINKY